MENTSVFQKIPDLPDCVLGPSHPRELSNNTLDLFDAQRAANNSFVSTHGEEAKGGRGVDSW
jgi:hypothetical protein